MKKKLLAMYALAGALVASPIFTSCVDDEESTSVTAIRNAKTEELKSIAALKKAEAEAEATIAAANVALKAAQAEAQVAAANLKEAETALQNTRNEAEAALLLVAKKQAEAELARIQGEIEQQEMKIQVALLDAQANLLNTKKQLEQLTKNYSAQEKNELIALANKYSQAVENLLYAKKSLISMESTLATYETELANAKENLEEIIAENNNQIEIQKIYIESYKQYVNYTEDLDALKKQQVEAQVAYNLASDKYSAAWTACQDAQNDIDWDALNELNQAIEEDPYMKFTRDRHLYDAESESYIHFNNISWDLSIAIERDENWNWLLEYSYNRKGLWCEYLNYNKYVGDSISYEFAYLDDIRKAELRFNKYMDPIKADIKAAGETLKADSTAYAAAVKATADAKKAWDDAKEADKAAEKAEYETALANEVNAKSAVENTENNIKALNKNLAIWEAAWDMLKNAETHNAALQEKIKAYNDAVKAAYAPIAETWKASIDAQIARNEADAELQAINNLLYNDWNYGYTPSAGSIAQWIENAENEIERFQEEIEEAEKLLSWWGVNGEQYSWEDMIAWQETRIEAQKAVVAAREVAVEDAKAALDAAMPADEEEKAE